VLAERGAELVLVAVLAVSESTDDMRRTLASWGVGGESFLVDREGVSEREAGVSALPATQLFDRLGALRWVAPPGASPDDVVAASAALDGER
jgi:hypothetical protein